MRFSLDRRLAALLGVGAALCCIPAHAADADTANPRYQQERARCLSGSSNQDEATCLREAAAARDEQRRGGLDAAPAGAYQRNAMRRCERLPAEHRADCEARMRGEGSTSGSVQGGAILRELVTPEGPADDSRKVTPVEVPVPAGSGQTRKVTPVVVPSPPASAASK